MATIRISLNEDIERILESLKLEYPALDYPELFKLGLSELYRKNEREAESEHATWIAAEVGRGLQSLDDGKSSRLSTAEISQTAEEDLAGSAP